MDYTFLKEAYQTDKWKDLLSNLFQTNADIFSEPYEIPVDKKRIESAYQLGNIYLNDQLATQLALFEFKLKPNTTKLQINRVALQKIVKHLNDNAALTGAFAVYVDEALGKWRFSFIAKQQFWEEDGTLQVLETDPKRYTYVFGIGEKVLTAQQRFDKLATIRNKSLEDITDAFSVEKVSKEFFLKYKKHYENLCDYLYQDSKALQIFKVKNKDKEEQIRKNIRDFVKKMMGRLVFLYFLQKKEWMGVPLYRKDWKGGEVDFMRKLFDHCQDQDRFYSKYLSPLFFDTLNDPKRKKDNYAYQATWGMVKVPYLNGGLFDETIPEARTIDFPADYFDRLLAFFSQYNFTIDENSPNDHEIGIDPEMLGHIFENLLEENRLKGAYYTPKEIVHYMCQESLLQYLKTKLLTTPKPKKVIWSDSQAADEKELELFVRQKKRGKKNNFIYKNAHEIEAALKNVKICDPAIGSGAFPMGLLYEIFHCQIELDLTEDYAALKREIIENCIYGVDKDKGAVDIAQLRFWLALVVNEEVPKILPNLDYKIMQGDSLLERFEDIDLSKLLSKEQETEKPLSTGQTSLFSEPEAKYVRLNTKEKAKIKKLLHDFFKADTPNKKKELQQNIDTRINTTIDKTLRKNKINLTKATIRYLTTIRKTLFSLAYLF